MKRHILKVMIALALVIISTVVFVSCGNNDEPDGTPVTVISKDSNDYVVVFTQTNSLSPRWANGTFKEEMYKSYGIEVSVVSDSTSEVTNEILIGNTNRALSEELKAAAENGKSAESLLWGFAYKDGKLAIYANNQKAFNKAFDMFKTNYIKEEGLIVPNDLFVTYEFTKAEQDAEANAEADRLAAEKEAEKLAWQAERLEFVKAENAKFVTADFGSAPALLSDTKYKDPERSLKSEHPRVMVTADMLPAIREALEKEEYKEIASNFWELADARDVDGIFKTGYHTGGETYRYDEKEIAQIEAKAFAYLLTDTEVYGYEAIYAIKNAMRTYKYITALHMDVYHGPSYLMVIAAEVYDWCYDLLTEDDKTQILNGVYNFLMEGSQFTKEDFVLESNYPKSTENPNGVRYGMELRYPPYAMNGVSGHGTGPQFLRDYMTVAVAFADERPDWWDCIGGRFYEEYLPVANYFMQDGWVSQGSTGYGDYKLYCYMWTGWLLKTATGSFPYVQSTQKTGYFALSQVMPSGRVYETGDGGRSGKGSSIDFSWMFLLAGIFDDSTMLANAKYYTGGYNNYDGSAFSTMTPALQSILVASCSSLADEDRLDGLDLINYFGHPIGQMTIRENWSNDCAGVFMKIGEMTMANHDNMDSGTFQIYYKGLLACTSGAYAKYGSPAHFYYLQGTVGANGLLIYNPAFADSTPKYNTGGALTNGSRYWYSGGQYKRNEAGTIDNWLNSGTYNMGTVTAYDSGYKSDKTAKFGYIAGDITTAYDAATVDYVSRNMLTVYTENEKFPMVFFVFDNMTSDDASFRKTFLLHSAKEPVIDEQGLTATITADEGGKLVLQNVTAGAKIQKIGGNGYAYWIGNGNDFDGTAASGKNCVDEYATSDNFDKIWGRVELVAKPEKTTHMLNVMYVTDAGTTEVLTAKKIEGKNVVGAVIDKTCAIFSTLETPISEEFSFVAEGEGKIEYYITGLYSGKWKVKVGNGAAKTYTASKNGGMIEFTANAGQTITVTPGSDILPSGAAFINYKTDGGTLSADAPTYYMKGEAMSLANIVAVRKNDIFAGWYTDANFTVKITEIPANSTGPITLYAKYVSCFVDEDYSSTVINAEEKRVDVTEKNMTYMGLEKKGSSFVTVNDGENSYLVWAKGSMDSFITATNASNPFSKLTGGKIEVSYTIRFGKNGDAPLIASHFRLQVASSDGGGESKLFKNDAEGNVYYCGDAVNGTDGDQITTMENGEATLRFVVNFTDAIVTFYTEEGDVLSVRKLIIPAQYENAEAFRAAMKSYYFYWYSGGSSDSSLRIYSIKVVEGNLFE